MRDLNVGEPHRMEGAMNYRQIQTQRQILDRRDRRSMDWAILIAIVLHIGILYLPPVAHFSSTRQFAAPDKPVIDITFFPTKPPPTEKPPERTKPVKPLAIPVPVPSDETIDLSTLMPNDDYEWVIDPSEIDLPPLEPIDDGPVFVGGDVKAPKIVYQVPPKYPELVRKAGIHGRVVLEAVINKQGFVTDVKVIGSLNSLCDEAAMDAVRQWRFEPGTRNDVPLDVIYSLTVVFQLK